MLPQSEARVPLRQALEPAFFSNPLATWSALQVKQWFLEYQNGKFAKFYNDFDELDGEELTLLSQDQFKARCQKKGDILYNFFMRMQQLQGRSVELTTCPETYCTVKLNEQIVGSDGRGSDSPTFFSQMPFSLEAKVEPRTPSASGALEDIPYDYNGHLYFSASG